MTSSADASSSEQSGQHAEDFTSSAQAAYQERIAALSSLETSLQREHIQLGYLRLALGIAVLLLLLPPRPVFLLPLLCFFLAARIHQEVLARLAGTRRALAFFGHGLARLKDEWSGLRPRPVRVDTTASLYASDLDLFGPGSLFEMICEARTSLGEDTLAGWLLTPAATAEVSARQRAVADLRSNLALREAFAAAPGPAIALLSRPALASWGQTPGPQLPQPLRWIAPLLVLLTFAAALRYATAQTPVALIAMLLVDASLTFAFKRAYQSMFVEAEQASRSLRTLAVLLQHIESQTFQAEPLLTRQESLRTSKSSASEAIRHLARLVYWAEARSNYVVRILDAPFLYSLQLALALGNWRRRYGAALDTWLATLGEIEALLSLAGHSFERPEDTFPTLTEGTPHFTATRLGHPLLPESQCVRNDVSLGIGTHLLLVSGSNMSGKSTLLRSVGINAVLAFAGAPVRAHRLSLSPLTVAASIQVSDSLQAGRSRFYAEILRLRAITEAARTQAPVLFLIDEVLAGTNSSDRLAGARGLVADLLKHGAIGLLSTHDLALTAVSGEREASTRNVHFEDEVIDGKLHFNYQLLDGVVERSNGLALMRLIGLDV